jgi:hypothetical protein
MLAHAVILALGTTLPPPSPGGELCAMQGRWEAVAEPACRCRSIPPTSFVLTVEGERFILNQGDIESNGVLALGERDGRRTIDFQVESGGRRTTLHAATYDWKDDALVVLMPDGPATTAGEEGCGGLVRLAFRRAAENATTTASP